LKIAEVSQIFELLFTTVPVIVLIWTKNGCATFWATFSQTHLVTLTLSQIAKQQESKRLPERCRAQ
jgi:hypothetical protein